MEISIQNFALIDNLRVGLRPGLNVLTGETGAGKSIIIDAVELALGGRASSEVIRTGSDRAVVDVVFDIMDTPAVAARLAELGLGDVEEPTLVLTREVRSDGRAACRVNGRTVNLSVLRELSQHLIDIHGQHEHQSLLRPERHLDLLDAFGQDQATALRAEVNRRYVLWQKTLQDLRALAGDERDRARRLDLLRFQAEEIERARLREDEEAELGSERRLLANAEKRHQAAARAYAALYSGEGGLPSAHDQLGAAVAALEEITAFDPAQAPLLEAVRQAAVQVDEVSREISRYRDAVFFDPDRLAEIESRLDLIGSLKRKYGSTLAEVIAFGRQARAELERLERSAELITELTERVASERQALDSVAAELSKLRRALAARLEQTIVASLADLGMKNTLFKVNLEPEAEPGPRGADRAEFLFSANPGEPPKPLSRIASGGEMSRVMLALKAILAESDEIGTMIFDEIDTGVGGSAAQAVGEKLATIALSRQVVCVTHLARIASLADHHLFIEKETSRGRTTTGVRVLGPDERVAEIARMLAGHPPTPIALANAREMLEQGVKVKQTLRAARVGTGVAGAAPPG